MANKTKAAVISPAKVAVPKTKTLKVTKTEIDSPAPPIVPPYVPKEDDIIARVYIEEKCASAYRMPLVSKPPTRFADTKTYGKENWPAQPKTSLPDPFPELDEQARAYLQMWPYGDNIVINRKRLSGLLSFYMEIRDMPLPAALSDKLKAQMEYTRSLLNLVTVEEADNISGWKDILKENWEPTYPYFRCTCGTKKRQAKKSPGAKAINSKSKNELEEEDE